MFSKYYYRDYVKDDEMNGACTAPGRFEKCRQNFDLKPEGNGPFGTVRHRWKDNIRMDFREIVWENVGWVHVVQKRDDGRAPVNTVTSLRVS
jgi:hypothetical protein